MSEENDNLLKKSLKQIAEQTHKGEEFITDSTKLNDVNAFIVVSLAATWDARLNEMWHAEKNKSSARKLFCNGCKGQVVMSNGLFDEYMKKPRPEAILCYDCFKDVIVEVRGISNKNDKS